MAPKTQSKAHKSARTNKRTSKAIKNMEIGNETEAAAPRTLEGEFLKRRRRRRLKLDSLAGTARESARVYRELAEQRISAGEAEVRSRVLRRHHEILGTLAQEQYLQTLHAKLDSIIAQGGGALIARDMPAAISGPMP
jgi:hypothetical protein